MKVLYWCLAGEMVANDLRDSLLYLAGEVELAFDPPHRLIVTWDENAGWNDDFSIQARSDTAFLPGRLEKLDGSETPQWSKHIGQTLNRIEVLGWEGTPGLIKFQFLTGSVYIGISHCREFRDGDDVLVCAEKDMPQLPDLEVMWIC